MTHVEIVDGSIEGMKCLYRKGDRQSFNTALLRIIPPDTMETALIKLTQDLALNVPTAEETAKELYAMMKDGKADGIPCLEQLTFWSKVLEKLKDQPGFKQFMRERIIGTQGADEGRVTTASGTTFELALTSVTYDYSSSNDPAWEHYEAEIKRNAELKSKREAFLKALDSTQILQFKLPDGKMVVRKVRPPTKSGTESFKTVLSKKAE